MPELPEVETMRRGILPIVGQRVMSAQRPPCRLRPILIQPRIDAFDRRIRDRTIVDVKRRGKRILVELEDQQWIVIEPRMTGVVLLADPPGTEHLRLRLRLDARPYSELLFWDRRGLGTVRLLRENEFESLLGEHRWGPTPWRFLRNSFASGSAAANERSRLPYLTSKRSPASGISTQPRSCISPGSTPARAAKNFPSLSGDGFNKRRSRFLKRRFCTKVPHCRTAPTATRSTTPAAIKTSTAFTIVPTRPAGGARKQRFAGSCRLNVPLFSAPGVNVVRGCIRVSVVLRLRSQGQMVFRHREIAATDVANALRAESQDYEALSDLESATGILHW